MTISNNTAKKQLVEKLIRVAILSGIGRSGGVGYHIKRLKKDDREIVQKLTSNDFNHRIR